MGYRAPCRKYYSIKDGKRPYISPTHIKQKIKLLNEFETKLETVPDMVEYFKRLMNIVSNDSELSEKCKQIGKK